MSGYVLSNARSAPVVPAMASIVASDEDDDVDDIVSIYRGWGGLRRLSDASRCEDGRFWILDFNPLVRLRRSSSE